MTGLTSAAIVGASSLGLPAGAVAQAAESVTVPVRQVSGENIYLDIGSSHGLANGDTVFVFSGPEDATPLGRVAVVATSEERSVLSFVDEPFDVDAGDQIRLGLLRPPAVALPNPRAEIEPPAGQPLGGVEAGTSTIPDRRERPAYGRISAEVAGLQSTTRVGGADPIDVSRTFATPALRLDLTVPDAVAGFDLRTSARIAYRYSDRDLVDPAASTRVYAASLRREFESLPVALEIGRFRNQWESYSGYTDGVSVRIGGRSLGVGFLAGLQPNRWNEGLSADRPKAAVFLNGERRGDDWRWSGDASAHLVTGAELERDRQSLGVSQRFVLGRIRLSQDLQLDRDPAAEALSVTHFRLQGSVRLPAGWTLQGGFTARHHYSEHLVQSAFGPRHQRVDVDLARRGTWGGVGLGVSTGVSAERGRVTTYSAFTDAAELPWTRLGGQIRGSFTTGDGGTIVNVAPSVTGSVRDGRYRLGYALYHSDWFTRTTTRHGVVASVDMPISRQLRVSLQLNGGMSEVLQSRQVRLQITRTF